MVSSLKLHAQAWFYRHQFLLILVRAFSPLCMTGFARSWHIRSHGCIYESRLRAENISSDTCQFRHGEWRGRLPRILHAMRIYIHGNSYHGADAMRYHILRASILALSSWSMPWQRIRCYGIRINRSSPRQCEIQSCSIPCADYLLHILFYPLRKYLLNLIFPFKMQPNINIFSVLFIITVSKGSMVLNLFILHLYIYIYVENGIKREYKLSNIKFCHILCLMIWNGDIKMSVKFTLHLIYKSYHIYIIYISYCL